MTTPDLSGKRILLLGAETDLGAEIARALAEAGASLALIAASNDPQTAFAAQRLARKLRAPVSQAIDATNEMAVRVMVRQVSKELGGLDSIVLAGNETSFRAFELLSRFGRRELSRHGGGAIVTALENVVVDELELLIIPLEAGRSIDEGIRVHGVRTVAPPGRRPVDQIAADVVVALAAPSPSG